MNSLLKESIEKHPGSRMSVLLDSSVTKGALVQGRSSSYALQPLLKRAAACQICGNLYLATSFAPTKLNVADDPSRDEKLREFSRLSLFDFVSLDLLRASHSSGLFRPAANWIRLALFLAYIDSSQAVSTHPPGILSPSGSFEFWTSKAHCSVLSLWNFLGFCLCVFLFLGSVTFKTSKTCFKRKVLRGSFTCRRRVAVVFAMLSCTFAGAPLAPVSTAEVVRAAQRAHINLASDRILRTQTRENREKLLNQFRVWLMTEHQVAWDSLFSVKPLDVEEIVRLLSAYGKDLHAAGKSYTKFSETINAVAGLKPTLKK